jgi:Fe-S-cluster containining protein
LRTPYFTAGAILMGNSNPCIACGACCAFFRTSFYWAESDLATPGGVPHTLTDHLQGYYLVMKGTDSLAPRCIALAGSIGDQVRCTIYEQRSTACRNFSPSWEDGATENERCAKARHKWGLPPLTKQRKG